MNRADLLAAVLPGLNKLFGETYATYGHERVEHVKKYSYGKYTIYKYTLWHGQRQKSETLAKGLTKEEADGFMKLLKEKDE